MGLIAQYRQDRPPAFVGECAAHRIERLPIGIVAPRNDPLETGVVEGRLLGRNDRSVVGFREKPAATSCGTRR